MNTLHDFLVILLLFITTYALEVIYIYLYGR